jgi:hypothetical protein
MYRKQAELEARIRELTIESGGKENFAGANLANVKKELNLFLVDIDNLEKEARSREEVVLKNRYAREMETKRRELQSEIQILKLSVERNRSEIATEEFKLRELTKVGVQVGTLDQEHSLLREKARRLELDIREAQDKRNRLSARLSVYWMYAPEVSLEQVSRELAEIRRDLAELKRK